MDPKEYNKYAERANREAGGRNVAKALMLAAKYNSRHEEAKRAGRDVEAEKGKPRREYGTLPKESSCKTNASCKTNCSVNSTSAVEKLTKLGISETKAKAAIKKARNGGDIDEIAAKLANLAEAEMEFTECINEGLLAKGNEYNEKGYALTKPSNGAPAGKADKEVGFVNAKKPKNLAKKIALILAAAAAGVGVSGGAAVGAAAKNSYDNGVEDTKVEREVDEKWHKDHPVKSKINDTFKKEIFDEPEAPKKGAIPGFEKTYEKGRKKLSESVNYFPY